MKGLDLPREASPGATGVGAHLFVDTMILKSSQNVNNIIMVGAEAAPESHTVSGPLVGT